MAVGGTVTAQADPVSAGVSVLGSLPGGWRLQWLALMMLRLECGQLTIVAPDGSQVTHAAKQPGSTGVIQLHHWRALRKLTTGGDIGFARAYIDGDWSSPDRKTMPCSKRP